MMPSLMVKDKLRFILQNCLYNKKRFWAQKSESARIVLTRLDQKNWSYVKIGVALARGQRHFVHYLVFQNVQHDVLYITYCNYIEEIVSYHWFKF